jgi:hypothetical protein
MFFLLFFCFLMEESGSLQIMTDQDPLLSKPVIAYSVTVTNSCLNKAQIVDKFFFWAVLRD